MVGTQMQNANVLVYHGLAEVIVHNLNAAVAAR